MNTAIGAKVDILGKRFGRLLVIGAAPSTTRGRSRWRVRCDCGSEKIIPGRSLLGSGCKQVKSCGCLKREVDKARQSGLRHGQAPRGAATSTYKTWRAMVKRCTDPRRNGWHLYGGRGIRVCERWLGSDGPVNFLADMGERPAGMTLDRIDPNGNYEPANCRWATAVEQRRNTRLARPRVEALLAKYELEAPDVIARLRKELLG